VRAIVTKPWDIYTWIRTGHGSAVLGLALARVYIDRHSVIETRE
jgi:hypothetical protein